MHTATQLASRSLHLASALSTSLRLQQTLLTDAWSAVQPPVVADASLSSAPSSRRRCRWTERGGEWSWRSGGGRMPGRRRAASISFPGVEAPAAAPAVPPLSLSPAAGAVRSSPSPSPFPPLRLPSSASAVGPSSGLLSSPSRTAALNVLGCAFAVLLAVLLAPSASPPLCSPSNDDISQPTMNPATTAADATSTTVALSVAELNAASVSRVAPHLITPTQCSRAKADLLIVFRPLSLSLSLFPLCRRLRWLWSTTPFWVQAAIACRWCA